MAKQKSTPKSKKTSKKPLNAWRIVLVLSLAINILMIVALIAGSYLESKGTFDDAIVNDGIAKLCSSQFRQTVENDSKKSGDTANQTQQRVALLDYQCKESGPANQYFTKGFDDYLTSLGIKH